jgi:hypothetical protein
MSVLRVALLLFTIAIRPAAGQSAQRYAAQISAMTTTIRTGGTTVSGAGVDVQQRFSRIYSTETFGALSLGLGAQYSVHAKVRDRLRILGAFVEPRWVPPTSSTTLFPYVSVRAGVQRMAASFQFANSGSTLGTSVGAGGGVAVRVTRTVNVDAGLQYVRQYYGSIGTVTFKPFSTYNARLGVSVGYPQ